MTPDDFRKLCISCKTPLAFAESCSVLTEPDRKKLSKTAQEVYKLAQEEERNNFRIPTHHGGIARLAMLATCPWTQAKRVNIGFRRGFPDGNPAWRDAAFRILLDHRPSWANEWVALHLNAESVWEIPLTWNHVRELMRAGVIERPTSDGYIRLLAMSGYIEFDPERDADILDNDVWRIFEVQTGIFDFFPEPKDVDREQWQRGDPATQGKFWREMNAGWPRRLYEWSYQQRIDRGRLIDAILTGLWRDFSNSSRTGLLRYLEVVEPTDDELAAREAAIGEFLRSEHGTIVGWALKHLGRLQKANRMDVEKFLEAVPAAFNISSAAQPKSALALIDRATKKSPHHFPAAVSAVNPALNHKSADVQEIAVDLLLKWAAEDPSLDLSRALSAEFLVPQQRRRLEEAAVNRKPSDAAGKTVDPSETGTTSTVSLEEQQVSILQRLSALPDWVRTAASLGGVDQALLNGDLPVVFDPDPVSCPLLSGVEAIEPIRDVDELIDAVSHLFEVIDRPEELERIADAIMRLGGERTENFSGKTEALRQTNFESDWSRQMVPGLILWCLPNYLTLLSHWLNANFPRSWQWFSRHNLPPLDTYNQHFGSLCKRFLAGKFGPILATPTHRGGWIDPRTFVARVSTLCDLELTIDSSDLMMGLLRLAPDYREEALEAAAALPDYYQRMIRYALGAGEGPVQTDRKSATLWLAAGRSRQPRRNLDELLVLGLSEREPDGITAAKFDLLSKFNPQDLKADRWSSRGSIQCVTVTPDTVESNAAERPTVALASRLIGSRSFGNLVQDWQNELMASLWPANSDSTLAFACHQLMLRLDEKGSAFDPVAGLLGPLRAIDRGWSDIGRTALWLAILSRDDIARGIGIDVMIDGIADGRAHSSSLGKSLLHIASGGWIKLNRLADSMREVTRTSMLAERVVAEILDQLISSWESMPRDGHHVLALQLDLLSSLGMEPSAQAREVLAAVSASGKSGKLARQLSSLSANASSVSKRQSALEAIQGRLSRAERINSYR